MWKVYPCFGGVRIECEECLHYATGWSEKESAQLLKDQTVDCPHCITCTNEFHKRNVVASDDFAEALDLLNQIYSNCIETSHPLSSGGLVLGTKDRALELLKKYKPVSKSSIKCGNKIIKISRM